MTHFIADSSATLRAAAACALRWIDTSEAESLLTNSLTSDPDAAVRLEVAVALGFRNMNATMLQAHERAFQTDKDINVRLTVLNNLWEANEIFPQIRQLVKQAAANDASTEVRDMATEITKKHPEYFQ
jgi:hypothetical protein